MWPFTKKEAPKEAIIANLDYDKLAAALVNAQREAKEKDFERDNTAFFSKLVLQVAFASISILLFILVGCGIYLLFSNSYPTIQIIAVIVLCAMLLIYAISSFAMVKSIGKIKDRNYLVSFFSAIVALTALIVTLIKN